MKSQPKLKILYSSRDERIREIIKNQIESSGHIAIECYSFIDIALYFNEKTDLFISDVSYKHSYIDIYKELREDKRYFVPNTIFITDFDIDGVECIRKEDIYNNNFNFLNYIGPDSIINFTENEKEFFKNVFSHYGLSYRYVGTMYLEEIIRITYYKPFPYYKKLSLCYEYLSNKYNISTTAIEKKIKRAIVYAKLMKGKGIEEICNKYGFDCPTIKFLVSNILIKLSMKNFN